MPLKIIFAGTPDFASAALRALLDNGFDVVLVLTQPDRPSGRGMRLAESQVKQLSLQRGLTVLQPHTLKDADIQHRLAKARADVMVVAAYGLILPQAVLQLPRHGCLNIHASLLPRWRGAAPIQRAILAGDIETGITIMQMDEGLDTGDMLLKKTCVIEARDNSVTLHDKLSALGAAAMVETLHLLERRALTPVPQDHTAATYAAKLSKVEAQLSWTESAMHLDRAVRAYNPFPGASTLLNGAPVKIWQASVRNDLKGEPGVVLAVEKNAVIVACGQGALCLEVLQRQNAKALPVAQFAQGFAIRPGDHCTLLA